MKLNSDSLIYISIQLKQNQNTHSPYKRFPLLQKEFRTRKRMWRLSFRRKKREMAYGHFDLIRFTKSVTKKGKRMRSEKRQLDHCKSIKYKCFVRRKIVECEAKWNYPQRVKMWKRGESWESLFWFLVWSRALRLWFLKKAFWRKLEKNLLDLLVGSLWIHFFILRKLLNLTVRNSYLLLISERDLDTRYLNFSTLIQKAT